MTVIIITVVSAVQWISIALIVILFLLGFKLLETKWSYKISKPYLWEEAVRKGAVSVRLKKMERFYRDKVRFYHLWFQIERLKKDRIEGTLVELGVYQGETARMIHAMDPARKLYLFDTFEGFSKTDITAEKREDEKLDAGNFADTGLEAVTQFVDGNENVRYYPGYFPDSIKDLPEEKYALVHLDADLYQPTLEGLKYFYPRLSVGGILLIHDYNHNWEGVRKAVDEFIPTIRESLSIVPDWQGSVMIVKAKNS